MTLLNQIIIQIIIEEFKKKQEQCGLLETVYSSFQAYMACIETNSSEISIGYNDDLVKRDGENIKNACVETLNYDIPEKLKSKSGYFFSLQKKLKIPPPQDDLASKFARMLTLPFEVLEKLFTAQEEQTCFDNKVSSYSANLQIDPNKYESLTSEEKANLDNQLEATLKVFLKECRREIGEKAYQDIKQNFKCDSISSLATTP